MRLRCLWPRPIVGAPGNLEVCGWRLFPFGCLGGLGTGAVPPLRLKQHGPQRSVVAGTGAGCRIRKRPDEGRGLPTHAGPAQPAVKLGVLNGSRTGLRLGMPPLQFEQHGRQQNVIRDASHAGGFGNRADEGRRVAALRRPAKPVSQFGVRVGGVVHTVTHLPFS